MGLESDHKFQFMSRYRELKPDYGYHITTRCNNREFRLTRLTNDGITQWHPAFLALGATLEICAAAYRKFCKKYKPQPKLEKKNYWGSKLLAQIKARSRLNKKVSLG